MNSMKLVSEIKTTAQGKTKINKSYVKYCLFMTSVKINFKAQG